MLDPNEVTAWTALDLFESVVVTVLYLRQNATEAFIGAIFDVSQATISRRRTILEEPVTDAVGPEARPGRDHPRWHGPRRRDVDPTSDRSDQGDLFSGKHHRAGTNVQVACTTRGQILALGTAVHGSRHDVFAFKQSGLPELLPATPIIADLGYGGIDGITTGTRRPPGRALTDWQKSANLSLAGVRSVIEQTIAHVKKWKVLKHYRGPLDQFDHTLHCVEALHNLEHSHRRHPGP